LFDQSFKNVPNDYLSAPVGSGVVYRMVDAAALRPCHTQRWPDPTRKEPP